MGYLFSWSPFSPRAPKASGGLTRPAPFLVVVAGYGIAFAFLSLTLRTIPVGVVYATWSGLGIVLVSLLGWLVHGQALDTPTLVGMTLTLAGVPVMNLAPGAGVR